MKRVMIKVNGKYLSDISNENELKFSKDRKKAVVFEGRKYVKWQNILFKQGILSVQIIYVSE